MIRSWEDFDHIVVLDYEFRAGDGNQQIPVCYVFKDIVTGDFRKVWINGDETKPEYPTNEKTLIVCFYASAEIGCHYSLGFDIPPYILDLYAEFRTLTNGAKLPCGKSLIGAGIYFGLSGDGAANKETTRDIILQNSFYNPQQKKKILDYCQDDVEYTTELFWRMKNKIDLKYGLLRGRYMSCCAHMEYQGIPIDVMKLEDLKLCWDVIKENLIWEINQDYDIYEGLTFKIDRFREYLKRNNIPWAETSTGLPKTDKKYMEEQVKSFPQLRPLVELRHALSQLKLNNLKIGRDGRNRCLLSPFQSITGRNQPSNTEFIFGPATWLRHLIKPKKGQAIAYVDYCQQEIGIAAALSGDENLKKDYKTGDVYLSFGKAAGIIPPEATKKSHKEIRDVFKQCFLAMNYGQGVESFSKKIRKTIPETKFIMDWHKKRYPKYWEWNTKFCDIGLLSGLVKTPFNWYYQTETAKRRTLMNWPMQSTGSDILRLAIIMCIGNGINVIAPIHDAVLIESSIETIEEDVKKAQYYMKLAALKIINFAIETEADIIKYPDRYTDPRGAVMWEKIWKIMDEISPEQKQDLQIEQIQEELPIITKKPKPKPKHNLSRKRRAQLAMKPENITEKEMVARIRKKSNFTHIQIMHLVNLARESDFDLESEVDWDQDYKNAKKTVLEGVGLLRKSIKDLVGGPI